MKRVTQLNHYEILDLAPTATKADIQQAFSRLRKTYEAESLAVYSLITEEERKYMVTRIEEAYTILIDDEKRGDYNRSIGLTGFELQESAESYKSVSRKSKKKKEESEQVMNAPEPLDLSSQDFLKQFRERKGISLNEISESTNIKMHFLSALENGNCKELPGRAYAIGFLREYAKFVGLDYETAKKNLDTWAKWK